MNTGRSIPFNNENTIIPTNVTLPSNDIQSSTVNNGEITKQMTIDEVANIQKFTFASNHDNCSVLAVSNNTVVNDISSMDNQYVSNSFSDSMSDKINAKFAKGNAVIVCNLKTLSSFSNLISRLPVNVGNISGNVTTLEQTMLSNLINYQKP